MSWASLLKAGGKAVKWAGRGAGRVLETGGKALLHPQQTLKGAGTAIKSVAVGGGLGYVGWKKLTTDESVVGIVSDAIIGEKATQKVSDTVHGAVEGVRDLKESFGNMTEKERTEVFFGVRPKLKEMNKTLQRLVRAVKYTSLTDVWNEISGNQPDKADIEDISRESFQRWRTIGKTVRP